MSFGGSIPPHDTWYPLSRVSSTKCNGSGPSVGLARAGACARDAGKEALGSHAYERALRLFEAARGTAALAHLETAEMSLLEARAHASLLRYGEAAAKIAEAVDSFVAEGAIDRAVGATVFQGFPGLLFPPYDMLRRVQERMLSLVPAGSRDAARLLCVLGRTYGHQSYESGSRALACSLAIARRLGDRRIQALALQNRAVLGRRHLRYPRYLRSIQRALHITRGLGDPALELLLVGLQGNWQLFHGHRAEAERLVDAAKALAEKVDNVILEVELDQLLARLALFQGRWEEARARMEGLHWRGLYRLAVLALDVETGRRGGDDLLVEAAGLVESTNRSVGLAPNIVGVMVVPLAILSRHAGRLWEPDRLRKWAEPALESRSTPFARLHVRVALALDAWLRSDRAAPSALVDAEMTAAPNKMLTVGCTLLDRLRGVFAGALGRHDQARGYFESALRFCSDAGFRPELGWTCLDYGEFLAEANERDEAARLARQGLAIATDLSMVVLSSGCARLIRSLEGSPRPDGLSRAEMKVLSLVAAGRGNQEIAGALFISYHTVVNHIRHIFGKTGVRSRVELTRYAHDRKIVASADQAPETGDHEGTAR